MKKTQIKKTLNWAEYGVYLRNIGTSKAKNSQNFLTYVFDTPMKISKMYDFLNDASNKHPKDDCSEAVFRLEDKALFDSSAVTAIDVILRHLKNIADGTEAKAHWCYLDREKKAVIHFINKNGWYAEAYFEGDTEMSFVHMFEDELGCKMLIPVMFTKDITTFKGKVAVNGGVYLQEYLPRNSFDFLGKKTGVKVEKKNENHSTHGKRKRKKDNRDNL